MSINIGDNNHIKKTTISEMINRMDAIKSAIELHAEYSVENGLLPTKKNMDFHFFYAGDQYRVLIEQNAIRRIHVACETGCDPDQLIAVMQVIEQILMIFEGRFLRIDDLLIVDEGEDEFKYKEYSDDFLQKLRLTYYSSADYCCYPCMNLLDYDLVDIKGIMPLWCKVIEELKIAHPMLLYSLSAIGLPVDIKCASIIQVFQPLFELLEEEGLLTKAVKKNKDGSTHLRECLKSIIDQYGKDIFNKELSNNKNVFLSKLVHTRNYIMHVSSKIQNPTLNGVECVLYIAKLSLLYRIIIFELLGLPPEMYCEKLTDAIKQWDNWFAN